MQIWQQTIFEQIKQKNFKFSRVFHYGHINYRHIHFNQAYLCHIKRRPYCSYMTNEMQRANKKRYKIENNSQSKAEDDDQSSTSTIYAGTQN